MSKFNVDGAAKGKPGLVHISGVLHGFRGHTLASFFSKFISAEDSNEVEAAAILEALRMYIDSFQGPLIGESSDLFNAISWVSCVIAGPWRLHYYLEEINFLSSSLNVVFRHVL